MKFPCDCLITVNAFTLKRNENEKNIDQWLSKKTHVSPGFANKNFNVSATSNHIKSRKHILLTRIAHRREDIFYVFLRQCCLF